MVALSCILTIVFVNAQFRLEKNNNIYLILVEPRNHNKKVIVCLIYRPPGQSPETDNKVFDVVIEICCHFQAIVMGDFNLPVER